MCSTIYSLISNKCTIFSSLVKGGGAEIVKVCLVSVFYASFLLSSCPLSTISQLLVLVACFLWFDLAGHVLVL